MNKILQYLEAHFAKLLGVPLAMNTLEFIVMLWHAMSDGKISHDELEQLMKAGDGVSMILLSLALAYLQFKKKD